MTCFHNCCFQRTCRLDEIIRNAYHLPHIMCTIGSCLQIIYNQSKSPIPHTTLLWIECMKDTKIACRALHKEWKDFRYPIACLYAYFALMLILCYFLLVSLRNNNLLYWAWANNLLLFLRIVYDLEEWVQLDHIRPCLRGNSNFRWMTAMVLWIVRK